MMFLLRRIQSLFQCQHRDYTFPFTERGTKLTTVVCHSCKRRIPYDWQAMKKGGA